MWIVVFIYYYHSTKVFLPGKSHGQRSLVGCSLWGPKEWDTTEWLKQRSYSITPRPQDINMFEISLDFKEWHRDSSGGTLPFLQETLPLSSGRQPAVWEDHGCSARQRWVALWASKLGERHRPSMLANRLLSFVIWGCRLSKLEISRFQTSRSPCSPSGSQGRETFSLSKPKTQGSAHRTWVRQTFRGGLDRGSWLHLPPWALAHGSPTLVSTLWVLWHHSNKFLFLLKFSRMDFYHCNQAAARSRMPWPGRTQITWVYILKQHQA